MKIREFFNDDMTVNWKLFEKTFPEMDTCGHSKQWHEEGSPLEHTKLVVGKMADECSWMGKDSETYLMMMAAALFHDIGKPNTTYWDEKDNDWHCKSHGAEGERIFRTMFMDEDIVLREKIGFIIRYHMLLHSILLKNEKSQENQCNLLIRGIVDYPFMMSLNRCDMYGSKNIQNTKEFIEDHQRKVYALFQKYNPFQLVYSRLCSVDKPNMYVMIGLPGSGKSTYAKELSENEHIDIISRDSIRIDMGLCGEGEKCMGSPQQEKEITEIVNNKIKEYIDKRQSFIIDNTSLKKKYRDEYKKYLDGFKDYNIIYVYVEAPSLEDNFKRRDGMIKPSVIKAMWDGMEFPTLSECSKLILVDQRHNKTYEF